MPSRFIQLLPAWLLCLAALASGFLLIRKRAAMHRQTGRPYTTRHVLRDGAIPFGMLAYGLRTLMIGYGYLHLDASGSRILLFLATAGVAGGLMASRIRRFPS